MTHLSYIQVTPLKMFKNKRDLDIFMIDMAYIFSTCITVILAPFALHSKFYKASEYFLLPHLGSTTFCNFDTPTNWLRASAKMNNK